MGDEVKTQVVPQMSKMCRYFCLPVLYGYVNIYATEVVFLLNQIWAPQGVTIGSLLTSEEQKSWLMAYLILTAFITRADLVREIAESETDYQPQNCSTYGLWPCFWDFQTLICFVLWTNGIINQLKNCWCHLYGSGLWCIFASSPL